LSPPSSHRPCQAPLTFESARPLALARNLGLEAARRQRAIREAAILNPDVAFDTSRDTPHETLLFNIPVELRWGRRIDLAQEELTLSEVDVRSETRAVRHDVRLSLYALAGSGAELQKPLAPGGDWRAFLSRRS
jgi:hypothetical protein